MQISAKILGQALIGVACALVVGVVVLVAQGRLDREGERERSAAVAQARAERLDQAFRLMRRAEQDFLLRPSDSRAKQYDTARQTALGLAAALAVDGNPAIAAPAVEIGRSIDAASLARETQAEEAQLRIEAITGTAALAAVAAEQSRAEAARWIRALMLIAIAATIVVSLAANLLLGLMTVQRGSRPGSSVNSSWARPTPRRA